MKPRKDLLDIRTLDLQEIELLLQNARPFKEMFKRSVKKVPTLRGRTVLTLFYEPSTRTRSSFEIAANRLSADVTNFDVPQSSVVKGESVADTLATLEAMRTDYIVVRHSASGVPFQMSKMTNASIINAGDGAHAHPTQALLDAFTIQETFGEIRGKRVLIVGDILHSRVARSTSHILKRLGIHVALLGPGTLVPDVPSNHDAHFRSWNDAWNWKPDVIYLLRVQKERQSDPFFPSITEYHKHYGLTVQRLHRMREEGLHLMHPGPVNRGVELADEAMEYERSLINQQVENGIAVRMSVLHYLQPGQA